MSNSTKKQYRHSVFFLIAVLSFIALPKHVHAKMYKWVDEEGVTQFSTFPPSNIKKDFQTISTSRKTKKPISENIKGIWLYQEFSQHYQLIINTVGMSINKVIQGKVKKNIMRASWTLSDKILTVQYKKHKKINKQGTNEKFFVVKATESKLVLVSNITNKKIQYKRKGFQKSSFIKISPSMQKLVGDWKGATEKNDISFSESGKFTIKGMLKRYYTTLYQGQWEYNDPELLFHFKIDNVIPAGRLSKSDKTEQYSVKVLTDDTLQIKSYKTGKTKNYLRPKKKNKRDKNKK